MLKNLRYALAFGAMLLPGVALAEGIVSKIVNAPLSATGTVSGARVGINVYLQNAGAAGIEFMNPKIVGFGIPAGGALEVEMAEGFERDIGVPLAQSSIMLVTGAPQQGLPGAKIGYTISEGADENTFVIKPTDGGELAGKKIMSPAPGSAADPTPNRGIKVIHIGFMQSAFVNRGGRGKVVVNIKNATGKIVQSGSSIIDFIGEPVAQILPTNFPHKRRNHNWQIVKSGDTLGKTAGTLPLTFMIYGAAPGGDTAAMYAFKGGMDGVGVLSTQQLRKISFVKPDALKRYNGGLVIQDQNGDGKLDPTTDQIIGGVLASAPAGATGQELKSLEKEGKPVLSVLTEKMAPKPGKRWGGSMLLLQFTAGSKPGKYRPTVALMKDPRNPGAGDASSFTYTIQVE